MKKMFLVVAMMLATLGAQANMQKKHDMKVENVKNLSEFVEVNDSTPYVINFYNVEEIKVNNSRKYLIRIYDSNYKLIKETREDVNIHLTPGNYFVACEKKIKSKYVNE